MTSAPSDPVTLLFADIEGSTRLWEAHPDTMGRALAHHDILMRDLIERHAGTVVKTTGDGLYAAFVDPAHGVDAAIAVQRALADPTATEGLSIRTRIGLHVGVAERRHDDYFGNAVNRASRIMRAAHGGQILVSEAFAEAVAGHLPDGASMRAIGSVRLRGLAQPERVWQVAHPELVADFPPLRSLEAAPTNLPLQQTSFVGREREQAEVAALLRSSRLVTLTGTGGLGKTRLSLQVGASLLNAFPDGVWIAELAPLADSRRVAEAVAGVLAVREEPGRAVVDSLIAFVRDRELLLILDNCEHLVRACAELAQRLLRSAPRLSILATSREHLRVVPEHIYPISALAVPASGAPVGVESLTQYEGVRLFVERAVAVQPAFRLTDTNAKAVIEICRRLDGIPLAIELAAARLRAMAVESVAAKLDDRFRLLARGSRSAEPRQQTLGALIDWSHDLLTSSERVLFRRFAVFAGGWSLQAAEAVTADAQLPAADVLDLLSALVEKSLVNADPETGRYRLIETVRSYAQQRLDESGETHAIRAVHLAYYLEQSDRASRHLARGAAASRDWLELLDAERENLLAAHAFCADADDARRGLELAYNTYSYWLRSGSLETGLRVIHEALGRQGAQLRSNERCRALHAAGLLGCFAGSYRTAQACLEESQSIATEIGLAAGTAGRLQLLALALLGQGQWSSARSHCEQALALARRTDDKLQVASALSNLAQTYRLAGELDEAQSLLLQSNALGVEISNRDLVAMNTLSLAMIALSRESLTDAVGLTRDAASIAEELQSHTVGQTVIDVVAALAISCAQCEDGTRLFGASEAHLATSGLRRDPVDEAFLAPFLARARTMLGDTAFTAIEADGRKLDYERALSSAKTWLDRQ